MIEFSALREIPDSGSGVLFWPINLSFSFEVKIKAGNNKPRPLRWNKDTWFLVPHWSIFALDFCRFCFQEKEKKKKEGKWVWWRKGLAKWSHTMSSVGNVRLFLGQPVGQRDCEWVGQQRGERTEKTKKKRCFSSQDCRSWPILLYFILSTH